MRATKFRESFALKNTLYGAGDCRAICQVASIASLARKGEQRREMPIENCVLCARHGTEQKRQLFLTCTVRGIHMYIYHRK